MRSPTVLLVGDNQDEREMYEASLPLLSFVVHSIDNLANVRSALEQHNPAVLVLNLRLDDEMTWTLLEEARCGSAFSVPGVLLTGSVRGDAANRVRARANGCAAFVAKPCPPDALAAVLHAVLAGARDLIVMDPLRFASDHGTR
ncbi:MAG: response regulator [Acidobacteria bacterium]|nr:response regulator [Acidobacteriota bacterium]